MDAEQNHMDKVQQNVVLVNQPILDIARRLAARGNRVGARWTLAQVIEHLALSMMGTTLAPAPFETPQWWRKLPLPIRIGRTIGKFGLLLTGRFPRGVPSPDFVIPSPNAELDASLRQLERAIRAFEAKLVQPDATWMWHPLLGRMTGRQWARFHQIHARHHFSYFREYGNS